MDSELLSPVEVRQLTGKATREGQCTKLAEFGLPFRRDGKRVLVSRIHMRDWLEGKLLPKPGRGPRFDLIDAPRAVLDAADAAFRKGEDFPVWRGGK